MYTYAQARRHEGEGLTFNAVSPGAVKTTLGSKAGGPFKIIETLTNPFVGPPEKGSRGCVRLMADPELATATGGLLQLREVEEVIRSSRVTRTLRTGCTSRPNANCTLTSEASPHGRAIASTAGAAAVDPVRHGTWCSPWTRPIERPMLSIRQVAADQTCPTTSSRWPN